MVTSSLNMKKFIGSIKRNSAAVRSKSNDRRNGEVAQQQPQALPQGDHPEAVVVREAVAFCEAGAPGSPTAGDEYLHLPAIVDAAESSPLAAKEVALTLQRYLSKQNFERGFAQYNAIMLMRILTDNPGHGFTQNFDKSFVSTVKHLLRECRDSSVQQICRETLDYFEAEKLNANDTLMPLVEMWRKEKGGAARMYSTSGRTHSGAAPRVPRESRAPRGLPPPDELASRIEEAKTSARLLVQMVQSTPSNELAGNELIKEFSERARQAHKSVQQYMACENPSPDEHTMLTLIETSEQLNIAMSKHQRAILSARRANSANNTPQAQQSPDPFSTTTMQDALPPQQPPRPQPQDQARYNRYESEDLYKNAAATVSPLEQNEHSFMPPPGPPPSRTQQTPASGNVYASTNDYQPVSPPRTHERSNSASQEYGVGDNPFADDHAYNPPSGPPPTQQPHQSQDRTSNSYSLFNRAAGQLRGPGSPETSSDPRRNTAELDSNAYPVPPASPRRGEGDAPPTRPNAAAGYNEGWQPTPSFVQRQESSAANINMSGAGAERR